jgi:hypothetical protein
MALSGIKVIEVRTGIQTFFHLCTDKSLSLPVSHQAPLLA